MMKMLGKMKDVQAKLKEAQDNLEHVTSVGESGAGMVKAKVNGKKQIVSLQIDNDIIISLDLPNSTGQNLSNSIFELLKNLNPFFRGSRPIGMKKNEVIGRCQTDGEGIQFVCQFNGGPRYGIKIVT